MKLLFLLIITSCSSAHYLTEADKKSLSDGQRYPACAHQYKIVFEKCVTLNDAGTKVNAMRAEQLMREGK